jgi:metal-responsive CopG/Arc/MetJ family transcriptional regulator
MMESNSERIVIFLPAKLRDQVSQLAEKDSTSVSAISRRALKKYVLECCPMAKPKQGSASN